KAASGAVRLASGAMQEKKV
ncbi:hypothetical protein A2U01_0104480, partial [Trifolium medium]|nr:hypothetical protein [Trifolium medium]